MKTFLMLLAVLLFTGCAPESPTKLLYSSEFKIALPESYVKGASFFYADELAVKTSSGQLFSAQIISNEKEKLPENFDIRLYPEYILKIRPSNDLSSEIATLFDNSANALNHSYDLKSLEIQKQSNRTIYSICKQEECLAMVVKNSFKEHILFAHTQKIGRTEFINLLSGGLDANK